MERRRQPSDSEERRRKRGEVVLMPKNKRRPPNRDGAGGAELEVAGLPPGWRAVQKTAKVGEGTYRRFYSLDGRHRCVRSLEAVVRLDAADRGADESQALRACRGAKVAAEKERRASNRVDDGEEVKVAGLPPGWRAVRMRFASGKFAGKAYTRYFSLDGRHRNVATLPEVLRLDASDGGFDVSGALEASRAAKALEGGEKVEVAGLPTGWLAVRKTIASGKMAGMRYMKYFCFRGRHWAVQTLAEAIRLDAADRGLGAAAAKEARGAGAWRAAGMSSLPPGWRAERKRVAKGKTAGKEYIRYFSPDGKHKDIKSLTEAARLDAIDRGLDASQAAPPAAGAASSEGREELPAEVAGLPPGWRAAAVVKRARAVGEDIGKISLRFYGPDGERGSAAALFEAARHDAAGRGRDPSQASDLLRDGIARARRLRGRGEARE